jgi:hypothetical protein
MAKKLAPYHGPPTEGPFEAVKDESKPWPWRVVAHKKVVAEIQSGRNRADAERVAACLNALEVVPTRDIQDGAVARLWLALRLLADLAEGVPLPIPPGKEEQFKAKALADAREALALVGKARPVKEAK